MNLRSLKEFIIEKFIFFCGIASILFVVLIFTFLLKEGLSFFKEFNFIRFVTGKFWYPISEPAQFGILPLILGSLLVTLGAIVISVPLSIAAAFYIAEVAPPKIKDILKAGIEMLAAIP